MSFGQTAPPATAKQVQYLLSLIHDAPYGMSKQKTAPMTIYQQTGQNRGVRLQSMKYAAMSIHITPETQKKTQCLAALHPGTAP